MKTITTDFGRLTVGISDDRSMVLIETIGTISHEVIRVGLTLDHVYPLIATLATEALELTERYGDE